MNDVKVMTVFGTRPEAIKVAPLIADEVFGKSPKRIHIIEPLEVVDFHNFLNKSYMIMTDSGGIQEEAPSLGKPVLVLRDKTERTEGIEAKTLKLVGTNEKRIYNSVSNLLINKVNYVQMSKASNPYGDGRVSKYIVDIIMKKFNSKYLN
ncbi:UDP-N-acetylglucosamine 2-epimerase [Clostridioides sp. ES-S-0054-01]|uniref:UDP-N-acetylglucosamine 2-epimerase n=1 Tax=unclassified Clostridioides TaxID=2635829 RepID=UPI0037BFAB8A